jgi:competence protein ComEA
MKARFGVHLPAILGTSAFWVMVFGAYLLLAQRRPPPQPIRIEAPPPTPAPVVSPTPAPLRVYVSGAVRSPGVYRLPPDSLVQDAILAAGGETDAADLVAINLARSLADGEHVHVPSQGETPPPAPSGAPSGSRSSTPVAAPIVPLDLNTATAAELEALPGIGPKIAAAIIAGRPYSTVEDLLRVKGIGPATLEKLRPYVTVR